MVRRFPGVPAGFQPRRSLEPAFLRIQTFGLV
jgi:hypothetical protein